MCCLYKGDMICTILSLGPGIFLSLRGCFYRQAELTDRSHSADSADTTAALLQVITIINCILILKL